MPKIKIVITLDVLSVRRVDRLVCDALYPNRSQAIEAAITTGRRH